MVLAYLNGMHITAMSQATPRQAPAGGRPMSELSLNHYLLLGALLFVCGAVCMALKTSRYANTACSATNRSFSSRHSNDMAHPP